MAYSDEAVEGAKKITANISLKALKRIVQYLADIGVETERQTLKESADYIDTYFRTALDSRIMYDTWQEIYDDDLLVFIHTEFRGKTEEKLSELAEKQVMKAFLFGYLAGVKDMDGLPESINNILAPGKKKGAAL